MLFVSKGVKRGMHVAGGNEKKVWAGRKGTGWRGWMEEGLTVFASRVRTSERWRRGDRKSAATDAGLKTMCDGNEPSLDELRAALDAYCITHCDLRRDTERCIKDFHTIRPCGSRRL